jgi:hypothetical protein
MGMIYLRVQHCSQKAITDLILSQMNADHTLASYEGQSNINRNFFSQAAYESEQADTEGY